MAVFWEWEVIKNHLSSLVKVNQSDEKLQIVYLAFVFPKDYAFNLEINVL